LSNAISPPPPLPTATFHFPLHRWLCGIHSLSGYSAEKEKGDKEEEERIRKRKRNKENIR
jgi:hypothetical protein